MTTSLTPIRAPLGPALLLVSAILLAGALSACGDDTERPNEPATLEEVERPSKFGDQISIFYSIRDREGDDQDITVEVCEAGRPETCGFPVQGTGGDGTVFVPTVPRGTSVRHLFRWRVGCGRFVDGVREPTLTSAGTGGPVEYVVRVSISGSEDFVESERFTLNELNFFDVPSCENSGA